jgi:tetratricopeptide (TPR) repeat protein
MEEQIRNYRKVLKNNPTDVPAFTALEEIYQGTDSWRQLVMLYEDRIKHSVDPRQQLVLFEKCASIWHQKLGDLRKAQKAYQQVLRIQPQSYTALMGMEDIYSQKSDWLRLAEVYEQLAVQTEDAVERADLYDRLGKLYLDSLRRQDKAIVAWGHALAADPKRQDVIQSMQAVYRSLGYFDKVRKLLDQEAVIGNIDREELGERYYELGRELLKEPLFEDICRDSLDKAESMVADPSKVEQAISDLDKYKEDWEEKVKSLRVEAIEAPDKARAVSLYRQIAEIYYLQGPDHISQVEENIEKCILLQPGNIRVLEFIERYYIENKKPQELVSRLEDMIARVKDPRTQVLILERIALNQAVYLQDKNGSIETYQKILKIDANYPSAIACLVEYYQEEGRWAEVVVLLRSQADRQKDPIARIDVLLEIAGITSGQLKDPEAARFLYEEILRIDEYNLQSAKALASVYEKSNEFDGLIQCLEIQLHHERDKSEHVKLLDKISKIHLDHREDPVEAFHCLLRAFNAEPSNKQIFADIMSLGEQTARYQELAVALRASSESKLLDGNALTEVLSGLADIYATRLSNISEAIRIYQKILEVEPQNLSALESLESLQTKSGGSLELVTIYKQQLALVRSGEKKKELLFKLTNIYRDRMADFSKAISTLEEILQIDEQDSTAWIQLADLYEREGGWPKAAEALESTMSFVSDPAQLLQYKYRLAGICEQRLNDTEKALQLCNDILSSEHANTDLAANTVTILERLQGRGVNPQRIAEILQPYYALAGDWRRHIDMLEFRLESCGSVEERLSLLQRIAQVYETELDQKELAFSAYGRAFNETPDDEELRTVLVNLAVETGHLEELAGFFEQALEKTEDSKMQISMNLSLGELYHNNLNRPRLAIVCFNRVLGLEISEEERDFVYLALMELYRSTGDWNDLANVLRARLGRTEEMTEKKKLMLKLAQLTEEELHDRPAAVDILQQVHAVAEEDLEVLRWLDRLLEKEGRWAELTEVLNKEVALSSPEEASELNLRLGRVRAERMEDRSHAVEHYRQVLDEKADDVRAIEALESLLERPDSAGKAAEILVPIYETRKDWSLLVRALEARAESLDNPDEQVRVLLRASELYDRQLVQKDRAFVMLRRAFLIDSSRQDILDSMNRLAEQSGAYDELSVALEDAVGSQEDKQLKVSLLQSLAAVYRDRLRKPDLASASLRRLLEIEPKFAPALASLESLYRESRSFQDLAWVLSQQAESSADPERRRDMLVQVAQLKEEQLGDMSGAIEAYSTVFSEFPTDIHAAKQLDRLYHATNRWEDEAKLLPKLAKLSKNLSGIIDYHSRLAAIVLERFDDPRKAIQIFRHILDIKPNHADTIVSIEKLLSDENCRLAAAEVLEQVYRSTSEWRKLAAILEMRLAATADSSQRVELYSQLRELYELRIGEKALAFGVATRAFKEHPEDEGIRQDVYRLAAEGQFFDELVVAYLDVADRHVGSKLAIDLRKNVAWINEKFRGKRAEALEQWEKLMETHGDDSEVLGALEILYREDGNFSALVKVYRAQLELAEDVDQKKDLLFRAAACLSEGVEDIDGGIATYQQILELDAEDRRALKLLDGLLLASGRWTELAEILDREIALASDKKPAEGEEDFRQELLLRKAQLQLSVLKNGEAGVSALREAIQRNVRDGRAISLLEGLLPDEAMRKTAAEMLEPVYRVHEDSKKLVAIMEVRLSGLEDKAQRLPIFRELMEIYEEQLTQKPQAFIVACRAFRENWEDESLRKDLERLAEQTGSFEELAGIYEEVVSETADTESGAEIERRLAQLNESFLEDKDEAASHWRRVLASNPNDLEALKSLERLYRERGAYSELVGVLRHMAQLEIDSGRKKDIYHEVATIMEERLGRNDGAIDAYREILIEDPKDIAVLKLLDRLLEKEERFEELKDVLLTEIDRAAESELTSLQLRLANIMRIHMKTPEEAVKQYVELLQREPDQSDALTALIEMFDAGEAKVEVARVLVDRLEDKENWRHLIAVLNALCEASEDPQERKDALVKIARIYASKLSQKDLAFSALGRAFYEDPTDEQIRMALERGAQETGSYELLAVVYERSVEDIEDRSVRLTLRRRLASLYEERLEETEKAIEHLQAVVSLDPKDSASLIALEQVYREQQDFGALAETLGRRAKLAENQDEATAVLYEIASIYEEKLGDFGGAIRAYKEVLEHQPDDIAALRMLDRLCVKQGRNQDLIDVLKRQIEVLDKSNEKEESLDVRYRLAHLYENEFADVENAAVLYKEILETDPHHASTVEYLEGLVAEGRWTDGAVDLLEAAYAVSGDWKKYIDTLETQVRQSRVLSRRLELLAKIAEVQEKKMGLKTLAFNTYVRMFHEDLSNVQVRNDLERIASEDETLEALAAVYEEELDNVEEPVLGAQLALKVAQIQESELEDDEEAIRFYKIALRFDSKNLAALESLGRLYKKQQQWLDFVDVMSRFVERVDDRQQQVVLLYEIGHAYFEEMDEPSRAVGYFRQALDLQPEHIDSIKMLERVYAGLGDHEPLYEVLSSHLNLTQDPEERVELIARLADIAVDQLGLVDEAIDLWQGILQEDEENADAFEALNRLYELAERWAELAQLIEKRKEMTVDPEKIAYLSGRLGWVKGEKLGDLEDAMQQHLAVLRLDPKDVNALQSLRGIYASGGQWEELLSVLRKLVPLQEDMKGVKDIRFELAEILGEKLHRREEAIEAAKRAQDIEPHSAEEIERLSEIFKTNEAWQDAVVAMEQAINLKEADSDKIEIFQEIASIWKEKIGRPLGAAPAYEKILEIDPYSDDAYRSAENIYRENKEWRKLTALLQGRLVNIREKKDRVSIIMEVARVYEENLAQKEMAFAQYCAAFREDFSDDSILEKLEKLAEETEDYDTLLEVFEDATEEVTIGPQAVNLYRKIANIYRRHLENIEEAEKWLSQAVELDNRDVGGLSALADLYRDQERWADLVSVLENQYERSDEIDVRKEIRRQIALIQEENMGRVDLAVESHRRILELDGRDNGAVQSLIRLYQKDERWAELVLILGRAADQAEEKENRVNYLYNIATIWETELGDDEEAITSYRAVLEADPTQAESLKALERMYTRLDRWSELLQVFETEVELIQDPSEKIKLYNKLGSIWEERFSNLENAAICHENILELESRSLHSIKALERLVKRMGDYNRLIDLYYKHVELIDDQQEIVDIHLAIGNVWYHELSRVDKAEEVFTKAFQIDDHSHQAIHALGQLYEKSGNWYEAKQMIEREAELLGSTPEAVDLYYRMGKINEDMLLDGQAARDAYNQALATDPSYLPAIKALKLIYYLDKDYERYLEMMVQEAEHTEDIEEKTRLYFEIGKFLQEQREDSEAATTYYEEALKRTGDFLPAAKPLADIYFRSERWERAEEMMEIVVNGLDRNTESKELCRQYYRLGYITEKLEKEEKALEHYRMSYELDATYLPALEGLGNALLKAEQWEEAYRIYQTILIHHRDSLSDAEIVELYWQIGDTNYRMGELDRAVSNLRKALDIDGAHLASLQYLAQINQEQENWEEAYDYGTQMVESMDDDELFEHYLNQAKLCQEKLDDPFRAIDALQGALKLRPDSVDVLSGLLSVFVDTRQFQKAVDVLEQIVKVEKRPPRLVEYHRQAGELLLHELHDDVGAVRHFNAVLDKDPSQIQSFQAISDILTKNKEWKKYRENLIIMIKRLPVDARKTKAALWKTLAELCQVVLKNYNEAIDAYRMVVTIEPNDVDSMATLAELLAKKPGSWKEATSMHHHVLSLSATRVKSYRALWRLYNEKKEYDKVYIMATILRYLKKANDEEQKIVAYFSKKAPAVASKPVSDKVWESFLAHPEVKVPFTRIFGVLYRKAQSMFLDKSVALRKNDLVDLARDRSLFAHNFRICGKLLGGMDIELYALKDQAAPQPPGLTFALRKPTAVIAFKEMYGIDNKKQLLFLIGRELAKIRPEFILASVLPGIQLQNLLQATCLLVNPKHRCEGDRAQVEKIRVRLKRALADDGVSMLRLAISEYLKEPKKYNLRNWIKGVEHSVNRTGLVICNDISLALGLIRNEAQGITNMRPVEKVTELLKFASSQEYLELRGLLGLTAQR